MRKNRNNSDYSIFEIGQNIESSPGEVRRLAVTQTLVKDHQLNNNNNNNNNRGEKRKNRKKVTEEKIKIQLEEIK